MVEAHFEWILKISSSYNSNHREDFFQVLHEDLNGFAWTTTMILRIHIDVTCHKLNVRKCVWSINHKIWKAISLPSNSSMSKWINCWMLTSSGKSHILNEYLICWWPKKVIISEECVLSAWIFIWYAQMMGIYYHKLACWLTWQLAIMPWIFLLHSLGITKLRCTRLIVRERRSLLRKFILL